MKKAAVYSSKIINKLKKKLVLMLCNDSVMYVIETEWKNGKVIFNTLEKNCTFEKVLTKIICRNQELKKQ